MGDSKRKRQSAEMSSDSSAVEAEGAADDEYEEKPSAPIAQDLSTPLADFPSFLPMQYRYDQPTYYVRKCYPEYYDMIRDQLTKGEGGHPHPVITVTGTPGIGKSVFYGYFYSRYHKDHPDTVIVTAAFNQNAELDTGTVFKKDEEPLDIFSYQEMIQTAKKAIKEKKVVLFLFDGPPRSVPPIGIKVVCFTSPNESWMHNTSKTPGNFAFYMPLWDVDELTTASEYLKLQLDRAKIEERFSMYGSTARVCLNTVESSVQDYKNKLVEDITSFDQPELKRLSQSVVGGIMRHRLLHIVPFPDNPKTYTVRCASTFISRKILEMIRDGVRGDRAKFIAQLCGIPKVSAFRGVLFEAVAHDFLIHGYTIKAQPLPVKPARSESSAKRLKTSTADEPLVYTCAGTEKDGYFDAKNLSKAVEEKGPYHTPRAGNFESVDLIYYPKTGEELTERYGKSVLLFQMTVAATHPVNGKGIITVLRSLNLLETALKNPGSVALIFIIPDSDDEGIEHEQDIPYQKPTDSEDVRVIKHIGDKKAEKLKKLGIKTLGGLRKIVASEKMSKDQENALVEMETNQGKALMEMKKKFFKEYKGYIEKLDTQQRKIEDMLQGIPQYVWKLNYSSKLDQE